MIDPPGLLLFVALSAAAIVSSRHAWRTQQVYGFYRFFAFESLVILIAKNAGRWFSEPLSVLQIISWTIFAASIALAVHGFHLLKAVGRAQARFMEDTRALVEVGAYRYIRHPLYASLTLFGWGAFLKDVDFLGFVLATAATVFLIATARYEEGFNLERFGTAYSDYMKRTKMFIPFLL
jgi:protein-S-isoprenylcysteine O-methyltransferase Ste14